MKSCIVLLAVCAFAGAMVPRDRRAVNSEELVVEQMSSTTTSTTDKPREICAPQTPCAWSTYKPNVKIVEFNITNSYCICSKDTVCQMSEDDSNVNVFIHRCRPPVEPEADAGAEEEAES